MTLSFPQWATALDLDFTAQSSQTLNIDTNYTIGTNPYTGAGLVWTKLNSANDATAMAVTNGTGLVIKPASGTNISGSTFSAPALRIQLNSIIPDWTIFMPFRIWVWISSNNAAATTDQAVFGTFLPGTFANQLTYSHFQGETGSVLGWGSQLIVLQNNVTTTATPITVPAPPNNQVGLMVCPGGVLGGSSPLLIGSTVTGGVWPALTSLSFATAAMITDASSAAISSSASGGTTVPNVNLFLSALRNGSGTSLNVTIGRIRVDFVPINN